jgi:hypothetical protein
MADFHHVAPLTIEFPTNPVYRVARRDHVLTGSKIRLQDSLSQAGHRFNLLSGRVIYCATQLQGSFAEVLSPFRQAPSSRNLVDYAVDVEYMNQGNLPANWRELRSILRITCVEPLPFLELENPKTLAYLDVMLATQLREFGVYSPLDISIIRGSDRRITRSIAAFISNQMDADGEFIYSGIRYFSRLGNWECWAIFEETDIEVVETREIKVSDPDLQTIAALYHLTIH